MILYQEGNKIPTRYKNLPEVEIIDDQKRIKAYKDSLRLYQQSIKAGEDVSWALADGYNKRDLAQMKEYQDNDFAWFDESRKEAREEYKDDSEFLETMMKFYDREEKQAREFYTPKGLKKERQKTFDFYNNKMGIPLTEDGTERHMRFGDVTYYDELPSELWKWRTGMTVEDLEPQKIKDRQKKQYRSMIKNVTDEGLTTQGMSAADLSSTEKIYNIISRMEIHDNIKPIGFVKNAELPYIFKYQKPTGVGLPQPISHMASRTVDVPSKNAESLYPREFTSPEVEEPARLRRDPEDQRNYIYGKGNTWEKIGWRESANIKNPNFGHP